MNIITKKRIGLLLLSFCIAHIGIGSIQAQTLSQRILADKSLVKVDSLAKATLQSGFNAGSGYSQIWARDMNTFIETACDVSDPKNLREAILLFFALQQPNNEMIDGYVLKKDFTWYDNSPYYSDAAPQHVAFKNTVETDQETSLIQIVNKQMLENVRKSGMPSIGLTLYPAYPDNFFRGGMSKAWIYQNGGDWTWFGGRMVQQLILNGFVEEAYQEINPMINRVIKNNGFYEWYGMGNIPSGSGNFKGSAGVLAKAIHLLNDWAEKNNR